MNKTAIINFLIGMIIIILGWTINRTLNKVDQTLSSLDFVVREHTHELLRRPTEKKVKTIYTELMTSSMQNHIIEDHR